MIWGAYEMDEMTYECAVKRLEEIMKQLEDDKLSLEKNLELFEEGTRLTNFCYSCLENAQQKIIKLSEIEKNDK